MRHWHHTYRTVYLGLATLALTTPALAQDSAAAGAGKPFPMLQVLMFLGLAAIAIVGGVSLIRMLGDD